jgi:hypothetical protein
VIKATPLVLRTRILSTWPNSAAWRATTSSKNSSASASLARKARWRTYVVGNMNASYIYRAVGPQKRAYSSHVISVIRVFVSPTERSSISQNLYFYDVKDTYKQSTLGLKRSWIPGSRCRYSQSWPLGQIPLCSKSGVSNCYGKGEYKSVSTYCEK